jgi:hypothetical protein
MSDALRFEATDGTLCFFNRSYVTIGSDMSECLTLTALKINSRLCMQKCDGMIEDFDAKYIADSAFMFEKNIDTHPEVYRHTSVWSGFEPTIFNRNSLRSVSGPTVLVEITAIRSGAIFCVCGRVVCVTHRDPAKNNFALIDGSEELAAKILQSVVSECVEMEAPASVLASYLFDEVGRNLTTY